MLRAARMIRSAGTAAGLADRPLHFVPTDLRNLVTAEEAFMADSGKYTNNLSSLKFQPTAGVNPPTITLVPGAKAWSATVTHTKTATKCGIGVNTINPVATADSSGTPQCK